MDDEERGWKRAHEQNESARTSRMVQATEKQAEGIQQAIRDAGKATWISYLALAVSVLALGLQGIDVLLK